MGPLLIDGWIGDDDDAIAIADAASVSLVRSAVRDRAAEIGLGDEARERAAAAASELGHNQLAHARGGIIAVRAVSRGGVPGIEIVAADAGPGIADPSGAVRGAVISPGGLGVGLSAVYRLVDELDVDVRWGQGTCLRARSFVAPVPKSEVAILGRPHPAETVSGDHAMVARDDAGLTLVVADGLGHGILARDAAEAAIAAARLAAGRGPADLLARCHEATAGGRGAVLAAARLEGRTLSYAAVGNIAAQVIGPGGVARSFPSVPGVVGGTWPRRLPVERGALPPYHVLVLHSDGLLSAAGLASAPDLVHQPAPVIAHHLLAGFARDTDDAIVAVAR